MYRKWLFVILYMLSGLFFHPTLIYAQQELHLQMQHQPDTSEVLFTIRQAIDIGEEHTDSSFILLQEALSKSIQIGYDYGIAFSLVNLGHAYLTKGNYPQSITTYRQAWHQSLLTENGLKLLPSIYNAVGNINRLQGNATNAVQYYYLAALIAEQNPPYHFLGKIYNNLSTVLFNLREFEKALYYLDLAEKIAVYNKDQRLLTSIWQNQGIIYSEQQDFEKGLSYFQKSLSLSRQHQWTSSSNKALLNMGIIYLHRSMPQKALHYFEGVIKNGNPEPTHMVSLYVSTAEAHRLLRHFKAAEGFLLNAAAYIRHYHLIYKKHLVHQSLSWLYEDMGQYRLALNHKDSFMMYSDSMKSQATLNNVNQLEFKYRTARKDQEIAEKKLLIREQDTRLESKNIWIVASTSGIMIMILLLAVLHKNYRNKQKLQTNQIHILQQQQQIGVLRATMEGEEKERSRIARDLHDGIGGMLAALKMHLFALQNKHRELAQADDYRQSLHILDETTGEIRKTAHNLMPELLLHHGFPEALRIYCRKMQQGRDLDIEVQCLGITDRLDPDFQLALYRMLQELVQNIVKHAAASAAQVQVILHEDILSVMVEDNGCGMETETEHEGMGLAGLKSRVILLSGTIHIASAPGTGTSVYLRFDLKQINTSRA